MSTYLNKEISEWNTKDLAAWLMDNKYPGISELCQNNSLNGYDLFFINDDILKNDLGLTSFHERKVTMKLINKLINEHLKLNIINSNGDNVILTLDNNHDTSLGELSEYIGGMFNMEPKDILYKDFTKKEVLSPTLKIIKLIILYPKLYKTLNVFNMKDYYQMNDDNVEQKTNDFNNINDNNNNNASSEIENENENDSDYQEIERVNNMNYNYKENRQNNYNESMNNNNNFDEKNNREIFEEMNQNRIIYNDDENEKNDRIIYNNDDNIKNKKYRSDQRIYRDNKKENLQNENMEEIDSDFGGNRIMDNYDLKYRIKTTYKDNNDNIKMNKDYYSLRNKKKNLNDRSYQENYNNNKLFKNMDNRDYYNNNNNSSALN
jgi:hypothetical protein